MSQKTIEKRINGERVLTMRDISIELEVPKYEIKNGVKEFNLPPTYTQGNLWYFTSSSVVPFLEYLLYQETLNGIKRNLKQWISQKR
jgi:hypothetical protein